jgi:hypothetical protein
MMEELLEAVLYVGVCPEAIYWELKDRCAWKVEEPPLLETVA